MKLSARCPKCKKGIPIKGALGIDRIGLAKKIGVISHHTCDKCATTSKIHVDDVRAYYQTVNIAGLIAFIISGMSLIPLFNYNAIELFNSSGILSTSDLFKMMGVLIGSPTFVILITRTSERNKINAFNHLKYDSKRYFRKKDN